MTKDLNLIRAADKAMHDYYMAQFINAYIDKTSGPMDNAWKKGQRGYMDASDMAPISNKVYTAVRAIDEAWTANASTVMQSLKAAAERDAEWGKRNPERLNWEQLRARAEAAYRNVHSGQAISLVDDSNQQAMQRSIKGSDGQLRPFTDMVNTPSHKELLVQSRGGPAPKPTAEVIQTPPVKAAPTKDPKLFKTADQAMHDLYMAEFVNAYIEATPGKLGGTNWEKGSRGFRDSSEMAPLRNKAYNALRAIDESWPNGPSAATDSLQAAAKADAQWAKAHPNLSQAQVMARAEAAYRNTHSGKAVALMDDPENTASISRTIKDSLGHSHTFMDTAKTPTHRELLAQSRANGGPTPAQVPDAAAAAPAAAPAAPAAAKPPKAAPAKPAPAAKGDDDDTPPRAAAKPPKAAPKPGKPAEVHHATLDELLQAEAQREKADPKAELNAKGMNAIIAAAKAEKKQVEIADLPGDAGYRIQVVGQNTSHDLRANTDARLALENSSIVKTMHTQLNDLPKPVEVAAAAAPAAPTAATATPKAIPPVSSELEGSPEWQSEQAGSGLQATDKKRPHSQFHDLFQTGAPATPQNAAPGAKPPITFSKPVEPMKEFNDAAAVVSELIEKSRKPNSMSAADKAEAAILEAFLNAHKSEKGKGANGDSQLSGAEGADLNNVLMRLSTSIDPKDKQAVADLSAALKGAGASAAAPAKQDDKTPNGGGGGHQRPIRGVHIGP